jgi:FAD synthetase
MERKVLVFGTFDRLHPGHVAFLREAKNLGRLHVVVARDHNVKHIKGVLPEHSERVRAAEITKAFPDADVLLGDAKNFLAPLAIVKPDLILLGYDQTLPPGVTMEDLGCEVLRAKAHQPHLFKSSLRRGRSEKSGI